MRPTLRRSSVEEFGRWYHAREAERSERREKQRARGQAARTPPMPNGYLTTVEAAARTGLSSKTLIRRAKPLGAVQRGRRWWIPAEAADEIHRQLRRERVESALDAKSWSPSERQQGSSAATTAQCSPTPSGAPSSDGVRRATNLHSVAAPSTASPANRIKNAASAKPRAPDLCDRRTTSGTRARSVRNSGVVTEEVDQPWAVPVQLLDVQAEGLVRPCGLRRPLGDLMNIAGTQYSVRVRLECHVLLRDPMRCRLLIPEVDAVDRVIHLPLSVTGVNWFDLHAHPTDRE